MPFVGHKSVIRRMLVSFGFYRSCFLPFPELLLHAESCGRHHAKADPASRGAPLGIQGQMLWHLKHTCPTTF